MKNIALGLNIDHVATVRNTRRSAYPDPLEVALLAVNAGVDFITVHLREDRRHINDNDLVRLKEKLNVPLNLEIAPTDEMCYIAKQIKPDFVCLVPEKRNEITTEGGLDLEKSYDQIINFITKVSVTNIKVTLFIEPEIKNIEYSSRLSVDKVEIHTGAYCNHNSQDELLKIIKAAEHCKKYDIKCHAGHGLDYNSAATIANIPYISALNIGHFLISEAIFYGIGKVITKMKNIICSTSKDC